MEGFKITAPKIDATPLQFLKEVKAELKKVKWPTKQAVIKMTEIVLGVSIIVGLILAGLDLVFTKIFAIIIK